MTSKWLATYARHHRTIEWSFLVVFLALFAYSLADWRGWLPFERGFQPLSMVFLSAALLAQAIASLVRSRSLRLSYTLLGVSGLLLAGTFLVGG